MTTEAAAVEAPVEVQDAPQDVQPTPDTAQPTPEAPEDTASTGAPQEDQAPQEQAKKLSPMERAKQTLRERREARQKAKEEKDGTEDQPEGASSESGDDRPRDEQGRFTSKEEEAPGDPAVSESGSEQKAEAPEAPAGYARIPLPEGHALRSRGMEAVVWPEGQERELNAILNQWRTRSEVAAMEDELIRTRALLEAQSSAPKTPNPLEDPKYQKLIDQIDQKFDPAMAEQVKRSLENEWKQGNQVDMAAVEAKVQIHRDVREFEAATTEQAVADFPLWKSTGELDNRMRHLRIQYGNAVDAENQRRFDAGQPPVKLDPQAFQKWAREAYRNDPRVQQALKRHRMSEREKLVENVRQEERRKLEEQRQAEAEEQKNRHGRRPPSVPQRGPTGVRARDVAPPVDTKSAGPAGLKKLARSTLPGRRR